MKTLEDGRGDDELDRGVTGLRGVVQDDARGAGRLAGSFLFRLAGRVPHAGLWLVLLGLFAAAETVFSVLFRFAVSEWSQVCDLAERGRTWCSFVAGYGVPLAHWGPGTGGGLALVVGLVATGILVRGASWAGTLVLLSRVALDLHGRATEALGKTPVTYFDAQPSGRLLGRFSDDYEKLAREIPNYLSDILSGTMELVWAVAVVLVGAPLLVPVALPCAYFYYRLQKKYVLVSLDLQRLVKALEAPSLSLFNESLGAEAAQVIRVHGRASAFCRELERRQRAFGTAAMVSSRLTRWLNLRLKVNAEIFALGVAVFVVVALGNNFVSVAFCGFLMSLSIGLDGTMQWVTRAVSLLEPALVSVERVSMLGDLPGEEVEVGHAHSPQPGRIVEAQLSAQPCTPGTWRLVIEDVAASYRPDLPDVLKGVSLCVESGQKIGIIGRTGSGKSTFFQLLYRMVHVRAGRMNLRYCRSGPGNSGVYEDVDFLGLPLDLARSFLTIVPQQPVLFSGSVRHNLDRLGLWPDDHLWEMLEKVSMARVVANLPGGLSAQLAEGGSNLSQGERQLLCIARAALSPAGLVHGAPSPAGSEDCRIVLLDEATASVDHRTDAHIGAALQSVFGRCTLLLIAHRLDTVRSCDRVVAFSGGRVVLEGQPDEVLNRVRFELGAEGEDPSLSGWL